MQEPDIVPVLFSLAFAISFFGGILGLIVPSIFRFGRPERPSRKRIAAISFALSTAAFVGVGVTMRETPEMKARAEAAQGEEETTKVGGSPAQAVISITEGSRIPRMKRSVVVRLSKEISHDELVALGKSIRDRDSNYERVFIEYYLPGMRENAGAWAVTHWKPNLEARILGSTQLPAADSASRNAAAQTGKPPSGQRAVSGSSDPSCVPTHQTAGWEFIENNAVRLADAYVAVRLPQAVFAFARPVVRPQITGKNKGRYLLSLVGSNEIMQLEPLFDFCTPADKLDDEGTLWRVVYAQYRDVIIEAGEEGSVPAGRGGRASLERTSAPGASDGARKAFFPIAVGKSVANCAEQAKAFDTNRRTAQAKKVEAACQADGNASGVSEACRTYAREITNAAYKFWRSMESDAGRGAVLGEEMRAHIARAREAAPRCGG